MANRTSSKMKSEVGKAERFQWARWNAPLVLLLLAFAFMVAADHQSESDCDCTPDITDSGESGLPCRMGAERPPA